MGATLFGDSRDVGDRKKALKELVLYKLIRRRSYDVLVETGCWFREKTKFV